MSACIEVVTPRGDLVPVTSKVPIPRRVERLAVGEADTVDALGQYDVARDRQMDELDLVGR